MKGKAYFDNMELTVGSKTLAVDGKTEILDADPKIVDNHTYLPVCAVTEALDMDVDWDSSERLAYHLDRSLSDLPYVGDRGYRNGENPLQLQQKMI